MSKATYDFESSHLTVQKEDVCMDEMMRNYFSTEDFGLKATKMVKFSSEERANSILTKTLKRTGERFEV